MRTLSVAILSLFLAGPGIAGAIVDPEPAPSPSPAPEPTPAPEPSPAPEADAETGPEGAFVAFDEIANHYKCYRVVPLADQFFPNVILSDQFKFSEADVIQPRYLCNPVKKNNTGIIHEQLHYVCFEIAQAFDPDLPDVHTSNQFGRQRLRPIQSELLCLPSKKQHL